MSSISIKKDYLNKIKLINKYNKFYYDKSNPSVSDHEYDELKKEILNIEHILSSYSISLYTIFSIKKNNKY